MQLLPSQDVNCCSHVDYYDVFISYLDSHSDGTHSLQRIYYWASDVATFVQICFMKNQIYLHDTQLENVAEHDYFSLANPF